MLFRALFLLFLPMFVFAEVSNIYRIGNAGVSVDSENVVDGTLFGYKRKVVNGTASFAGDINYIIVDENPYGVEDTVEVMAHIGTMVSNSVEIFGSAGVANDGDETGAGWGYGLVYSFGNGIAITYEYRDFSMDNYDLQSVSLGILIGF